MKAKTTLCTSVTGSFIGAGRAGNVKRMWSKVIKIEGPTQKSGAVWHSQACTITDTVVSDLYLLSSEIAKNELLMPRYVVNKEE